MIWQDLVLTIGGFALSIALLPSITSKNKPSKYTSMFTGTILASFTVCYATLGLTMASIATASTASLWFVLLIQRLRK